MRKVFLLLTVAMVWVACGGKKETENFDLGKKIGAEEKKLDLYNPDPARVNELIRLYTRFADSLPHDKKAPVYLMKASDLYHLQGKYALKCELYKTIISKFPDYKDMDMVMYLYAFSLDSELDMRERAKEQYQAFIEAFPNSQLAPDARARLSTIDSLSFKQLEEKITRQPLDKAGH